MLSKKSALLEVNTPSGSTITLSGAAIKRLLGIFKKWLETDTLSLDDLRKILKDIGGDVNAVFVFHQPLKMRQLGAGCILTIKSTTLLSLAASIVTNRFAKILTEQIQQILICRELNNLGADWTQLIVIDGTSASKTSALEEIMHIADHKLRHGLMRMACKSIKVIDFNQLIKASSSNDMILTPVAMELWQLQRNPCQDAQTLAEVAEICELLLKKGADPYKQCQNIIMIGNANRCVNYFDAMHVAIEDDFLPAVKLFFAHAPSKENVTIWLPNGHSGKCALNYLMLAAVCDHAAIVEYFLECGFNANLQILQNKGTDLEWQMTPLYCALFFPSKPAINSIQLLLQYGGSTASCHKFQARLPARINQFPELRQCNFDYNDQNHSQLLHYLIAKLAFCNNDNQQNILPAIDRCLLAGANPMYSADGKSCAVFNMLLYIVKFAEIPSSILELFKKIIQHTPKGEITVLSTPNDHTNILRLLIGSTVNQKVVTSILQVLLQYSDIDVNAFCTGLMRPLTGAINEGKIYIVDILLQHGAKVAYPNVSDDVFVNNATKVMLLLENGTKVRYVDMFGDVFFNNALEAAIFKKSKMAISLILQQQANPNTPQSDKIDHTTLDRILRDVLTQNKYDLALLLLDAKIYRDMFTIDYVRDLLDLPALRNDGAKQIRYLLLKFICKSLHIQEKLTDTKNETKQLTAAATDTSDSMQCQDETAIAREMSAYAYLTQALHFSSSDAKEMIANARSEKSSTIASSNNTLWCERPKEQEIITWFHGLVASNSTNIQCMENSGIATYFFNNYSLVTGLADNVLAKLVEIRKNFGCGIGIKKFTNPDLACIAAYDGQEFKGFIGSEMQYDHTEERVFCGHFASDCGRFYLIIPLFKEQAVGAEHNRDVKSLQPFLKLVIPLEHLFVEKKLEIR